jgi:MFS family permease
LNTANVDADKPVGYLELIRRNANFRFLWSGEIISLLGDWFNLIASASLVASLTESGLAVGSLFVVRMLAPFLVSPLAGVAADRYNRKRILIATDILRAMILFCFLFVRDAGDIWLLYTLTGIQFCISGFFFPARNAILPDIVSARELGTANAISSATWSVMLAFGAALGGVVSGVWGIYPAFVIDGLTFLASAICIAQLKLQVSPALESSDKTIGAILEQYLDGLRYLAQNSNILVISLHKAALGLLAGSTFEIIMVAISEDVFTLGVGGGIGLGLMFGMNGVGSGLGPIIARYFTGDRNRALSLAIIFGYFMIVVGYMVTAPLFNFGSTLLGILLRGSGGGIVWVFSTQLLLQLVSGHVRGRVFAAEFAFFTLTGVIGAVLVGNILDSPLGISGALLSLAGLVLIPGMLWVLWLVVGGKAGQPAPEDVSI